MSKIICDVCGTSYPETATQCPICGCVRSADAQSLPATQNEDGNSASYQHVKGGRFSKSNVRKRNATSNESKKKRADTQEPSYKQKKEKRRANTGLWVTIFILLLAILLVAGYIFAKFFLPNLTSAGKPGENTGSNASTAGQEQPKEVPCQRIMIEYDELIFESIGQKAVIQVSLLPEDTTDKPAFLIADNAIATVDNSGTVTAQGFGTTVLTISCGDATAECSVTIVEPFELTVKSVSFDSVGAMQRIYEGTVPASDIVWSSDDDAVATVADGIITAVGNGKTNVYGSYNGITLTCIVKCVIPDATEETTQPTDAAAQGPYELKNIQGVSSSDVTLHVGESFTLVLLDANGDEIDGVEWSIQNGSSCTVTDGAVNAVAIGYAEVVASYNGETFVCIVRVN